jgi:hypothetical protein
VKFWIPWAINAVVAIVVLYFFLVGLADGSVSSFNIGLWFLILLGLAGVLGGGLWLKSAGHGGLAAGLLLILATPGILYGLFLVVLLISAPRWN